MTTFDLNRDERAAADAAQSEAGLLSAIPAVKKSGRPQAALHLACEGDTLEQDSLDIVSESLPLFDTHGNRHLG